MTFFFIHSGPLLIESWDFFSKKELSYDRIQKAILCKEQRDLVHLTFHLEKENDDSYNKSCKADDETNEPFV